MFTCLILVDCSETNDFFSEELSETEAYELINKHLIKRITPKDKSKIYWCVQMIKKPKIDSSYYDSFAPMISPSWAISKQSWDTTKLKNVTFVSFEEYRYYFQKNDSINLNSEWEVKSNGKYLHCVSFPKRIPKTDTYVIKHILTRPKVFCGTGLFHEFFYVKTEDGWKEK